MRCSCFATPSETIAASSFGLNSSCSILTLTHSASVQHCVGCIKPIEYAPDVRLWWDNGAPYHPACYDEEFDRYLS